MRMKTDKCPTCGGIVFKLAGKAAAICYDECLDCRKKRDEAVAIERNSRANWQNDPDHVPD